MIPLKVVVLDGWKEEQFCKGQDSHESLGKSKVCRVHAGPDECLNSSEVMDLELGSSVSQ